MIGKHVTATLGIVLALCGYASPGDASPMFTYRYTGQPFAASAFVSGGGQQCYPLYDDLTGNVYENCVDIFIPGSGSSGYTTDNRVSFQFSTSRPLPPDATYVMNDLSGTANPTLLSWSVSDGTNSFDSTTGLNETATSAEGLLETSEVTTDNTGSIVSWFFDVQQVSGIFLASGPADQLGVSILSCGRAPCVSSIGVSGQYAGEEDAIFAANGDFLLSGAAITPGTWTVPGGGTVVPEPATLTLLGVGLIGLGVIRHRADRAA